MNALTKKIKKSGDISKHELVPRHEVLSPDEAESIVKLYSGNRYQFPYILASDPVVASLGAEVGDMIMITRKSATSLQFKYYRLVAEE